MHRQSFILGVNSNLFTILYVGANCTEEDPRYGSKYVQINKCAFLDLHTNLFKSDDLP